MQTELQVTLSIIGILVIGGVLLHGMWTIRTNAKKQKKARLESRNWEPGFDREGSASGEPPIYDDVGVGKARVIINNVDESDEENLDDFKDVSLGMHDEIIESQFTDSVNKNANIDQNDGPITHKETINDNDIDEVITNNYAEHESLDSGVTTANDESFEVDIPSTEDISAEQTSGDPQHSSVSINAEEVKAHSTSPVYSNVVTQPKPEFTRPAHENSSNDDNFGQPPDFLMRKLGGERQDNSQKAGLRRSENDNAHLSETKSSNSKSEEATKEAKPLDPDFSLNIQDGPQIKYKSDEPDPPAGVEKELSFAEQAKRFVRRNKRTVAEKIRKEPVIKDKAGEDQMRIDFDEADSVKAQDGIAASPRVSEKSAQSDSARRDSGETDVLVLNVRASDQLPIQGASLLPMLLTLGFKFGEHDIFHRHVSTNGKGPVLFSLTSMFKPGVFDIDNIENFSTFGLSLFMMLPIEGDAQQVFNMMHNAARKLSDEFGCRILDGNKVGLSKQSLQQYVERIREFERRRINK